MSRTDALIAGGVLVLLAGFFVGLVCGYFREKNR